MVLTCWAAISMFGHEVLPPAFTCLAFMAGKQSEVSRSKRLLPEFCRQIANAEAIKNIALEEYSDQKSAADELILALNQEGWQCLKACHAATWVMASVHADDLRQLCHSLEGKFKETLSTCGLTLREAKSKYTEYFKQATSKVTREIRIARSETCCSKIMHYICRVDDAAADISLRVGDSVQVKKASTASAAAANKCSTGECRRGVVDDILSGFHLSRQSCLVSFDDGMSYWIRPSDLSRIEGDMKQATDSTMQGQLSPFELFPFV